MKNFLTTLPRNILKVFWGKKGEYLAWHILAIGLTYILVITDFDWIYFQHFRSSPLLPYIFPALALGGLLPIYAPVTILILGAIHKNRKTLNLGLALAQAVFIGSIFSSFYKALTGRAHPSLFSGTPITNDTTHIFKFGLLRGGIFWGWPSSHTTIAFAMAITLFVLFPRNKLVRFFALAYAFYIGLSVSISIHWFSDFVAGAIIGSLIGIVVGKSFFRLTRE